MADYEARPATVDSCPTGWMTFGGVLGAFVWTAEREESLWLLAQFTSAGS